MSARLLAKRMVFWAATVAVAPWLVSYRLRAAAFGSDRALEGSTQLLSLVPGILGQKDGATTKPADNDPLKSLGDLIDQATKKKKKK